MTTERLRLAAFRPDDARELHEIFSDPATFTIGDGPYGHVEQTEGWIKRRIATHRDLGICWYGLRDRESNRLIGNCGVFVGRTGVSEQEIGYMVRHNCQGRGYASEAASAVMTECARVQLARVWATVRPCNAASLRVLERIGMEPDRSEEDAKGVLLFLSRTLNADADAAG